jgi:hypothetical protein
MYFSFVFRNSLNLKFVDFKNVLLEDIIIYEAKLENTFLILFIISNTSIRIFLYMFKIVLKTVWTSYSIVMPKLVKLVQLFLKNKIILKSKITRFMSLSFILDCVVVVTTQFFYSQKYYY